MAKDKLISPSFCYILAANFLLFFAFYLILPILPFYLQDQFDADKSMIGFILSCYTIAALCIRPFSGYLLDTFARRPLYLLAYSVFMVIFAGYMIASLLSIFIVLRILHGFAFGMVTVSGNYDRDRHPALLPPWRGDRLLRAGKQYGHEFRTDDRAVHAHQLLLTKRFSPALSFPASSLHHGLFGKDTAETADKERTDLAGPFLFGERHLGWHLLTAALHTYGMTTTYVAMYADEIGISVNSGLYFTFMAIGLAVSRMFSGRQVDKGRTTLVISLGMYLAAASFFGLAALERLMQWNSAFTSYLYIGIALSQGVAFGTMFPAFNTLFVNLAPNSQRGQRLPPISPVGMWGSGSADDRRKHRTGFGGFNYAYLFGACLTIFSTLFFY